MSNRYIDVVTKHPGELFCDTRLENTEEAIFNFLGGAAETVAINSQFVIICNASTQGLPHCVSFHRDLIRGDMSFYGPIIIAGINGDKLEDLPVSAADFNRIWEGGK